MTSNSLPESTVASFQYLANDNDLAVYIASVGGAEALPHQGNYVCMEMPVINGRPYVNELDLDTQGFRLVNKPSKVTNFYDDVQIKEIYETEISQLVLEQTGASSIKIFDHTRRAASEQVRIDKKIREPASIIHNDYTENSGSKRLRALYPGLFESLGGKRFAIINVWRSINGLVENHPLTLCDATSVDQGDLVAVTRQAKDRMGEIQLATYNPGHRWFYFPAMTMDELIIFKTFDSSTDGRTRFTLHSAFDDPTVLEDARPRESVETRCFVFYD